MVRLSIEIEIFLIDGRIVYTGCHILTFTSKYHGKYKKWKNSSDKLQIKVI